MRLLIKNFSCLESADIEFKDYTVFIGEQASGKSLVCKLYFFLRDTISRKMLLSIAKNEEWDYFDAAVKQEFYEIFPEYTWKDSDFSLVLKGDEGMVIISVEYKKGMPSILLGFHRDFEAVYKMISEQHQSMIAELEEDNNFRALSFFLGSISFDRILSFIFEKVDWQGIIETVTFIPSGRSFFSVIRDNIFGMLSENINIEPMLKSFGKVYESSKKLENTIEFIAQTEKDQDFSEFNNLSKIILKAQFQSDKKDDWLVSGNRKINVSTASSGQQEALPVILVLRSLISQPSKFGFGMRSVVIEEPEAHLFPSSQKAMVELLFLTSTMGSKPKIIITTHSPYVLTCVNNDLLKIKGEPGAKISAYYLSGGKAYDIVDKTSGLIDGSDLDKISSEIAEEFYAALESA